MSLAPNPQPLILIAVSSKKYAPGRRSFRAETWPFRFSR